MEFLGDVRIAARTLARSPGFLAACVGVLALGVAAVVVMFAFLRVITTPPPLDRMDRVFALSPVDTLHNDPEKLVAIHDLEDWDREQRSFEWLAGMLGETVAFRRIGADPEPMLAGRVTGSFFSLMRVKPLLGRNLTFGDAERGATPVAVISERLWRSSFGADPSVLGETVRIDGTPTVVVGVAPAALDLPVSALLWFPDRTDTAFDPQLNGPLPRLLSPFVIPLGRLRDGVTPDAARAELQAIQARRVARYAELAHERPEVRPLSLLWMRGGGALGGSALDTQRLHGVLFGSVLLVLVLACVNVAGLLLMRSAGRTHEAAVRRALGASRSRLIAQMLAESSVIGAAAAALALVLAAGAMEALRRAIPALLPATPSWWRVRLDVTTVAFALGTTLVAALAAGAYPALRAARVSIDPLLREGQREPSLHASRLVRWLVVLEIALSAGLLTAAELVIRAGAKLGAGEVGVPTAGFLMARIQLPRAYSFSAMREYTQRLRVRLWELAGVESTALSSSPPGITPSAHLPYLLPDRHNPPLEDLPFVEIVAVTPGFFESFRIPVKGRTFLDTDAAGFGMNVAVVSESMARAAWPGESPIGKVLQVAPRENLIPPLRVVGVAGDVRYDERLRAQGAALPIVYTCLSQWPSAQLYVTLRAPHDRRAVADELRRAVRELQLEPPPMFSVRTLDEERQRNAASLVLVGRMFALFGALAFVLAAAGVYGLAAHVVAVGRRELAIRRALGAPRRRVAAAVLARFGWQLVLGLALGIALAPVASAVVGSVMLATDSELTVYLQVAVLLSATLVISVSIPLWRALRLEPAAVLRHT